MFNAYLLGKQRTAVFGVLLCVIASLLISSIDHKVVIKPLDMTW